MKRDLLSEATRALREETARDDELARAIDARRAQVTRDRIVTDLSRGKVGLPRGVFLVPLAAILIGSTAWASGLGPAAWRALTAPRAETLRARTSALEIPALPPHDEADAAPAEPEAEVVAESEEAAPSEAPSNASVAPPGPIPAVAATHAAPAEPPPEPVVEPAVAIYRDAHRAHFVENDPARALDRWNAYLAAAPSGRFAPEAAYNRAHCLARLGQTGAAIAALTPFANGAYGAYRQAEAQQIIAALTPPSAPTTAPATDASRAP